MRSFRSLSVCFFRLVTLILFVLSIARCSQGGEIKATAEGIMIDAGAAGTYVMSYPHLLNPSDQGLIPEHIVVKSDGSGATMTYRPSAKLTLDQQTDGSWLFHVTGIPPDRMKLAFGISFPLKVIEEGATWTVNGEAPRTFSAKKATDKVDLYKGNPESFGFTKNKASFTITYADRTWTQIQDQRPWGIHYFQLANIYYFPAKITLPEINYLIFIKSDK